MKGVDAFIRYSMVLVVFPGSPLRMMMRFRSFCSLIESGSGLELVEHPPAVMTLALRPSSVRMSGRTSLVSRVLHHDRGEHATVGHVDAWLCASSRSEQSD